MGILRSIQGPVLAMSGCKACDVYEDLGQEPAALLIEQWVTKESFETHIRSEACRRILDAIEVAGRRPEVRFDIVSKSEGMELIERLRKREGTGAMDSG